VSIRSLFEDRDIIAYVEENRERRPAPPWVFVHVPEAISASFREQLADALQPDYMLTLKGTERGANYDEKVQDAVQAFCNEDDFQRARLITGHFKAFQLDSVDAMKNAHRLTMLRDPVERLLSDFKAQSEPKAITAPGFLEFAKKPMNQNVFLQYLCPKSLWKPKDCTEYMLDRYSFIGSWEDANLSLKMFYSLLGMRGNLKPVEPDTAKSPLQRSDLSPDLVRTVARLNGADYEIYRFFHDRFIALKEKFFELNDYGRMFRQMPPAMRETH
jgi:hypothetical protein